MRALFLIPAEDAPRLDGPFSPEFKSFIAQCLQKVIPQFPPSTKYSAGKLRDLSQAVPTLSLHISIFPTFAIRGCSMVISCGYLVEAFC